MRSHTAGAIVARQFRMLLAFSFGMLLAAWAMFAMAGVQPAAAPPRAAALQPQAAAAAPQALHATAARQPRTDAERSTH